MDFVAKRKILAPYEIVYNNNNNNNKKQKQTPWPESVSDRRLSVKLVPILRI
jgi:hypothetical protein